MRSIDYDKVEAGVAAIAGIDPSNVLTHEKVLLAEYINDATRYCWDYYPWSEAVKIEKRYFREDYDSNNNYAINDEVHSAGKYYRLYNISTRIDPPFPAPAEDLFSWYEIGDINDDPSWQEELFYKIGSRVVYKGETYLCIANLGEDASTDIDIVNYFYDKILPTNEQYWLKIDPVLKRYIPFEQDGFDTIGTVLSIHIDDPKFSSGRPLNWTEENEGVFVEMPERDINFVYLKYRPEAPVYSHNTTGQKVPNFLAPAIKAYAYKSWLIGDGQHEKSQLQDMQAIDLLLREVDKLNHQQDRGQKYQISSEPYRRVNASASVPTEQRYDRVSGFKTSTVDTKLGIFVPNDIPARNAHRPCQAFTTRIRFDTESDSIRNYVKKADSVVHVMNIRSYGSGRQAVLFRGSSSDFKLFTGAQFRATGIGFVKGIEQGVIAYHIGINVSPITAHREKSQSVDNVPLSITTEAEGRQATVRGTSSASAEINLTAQGRQASRQATVMQVKMSFVALGEMVAWASRASWDDVNVHWEKAK